MTSPVKKHIGDQMTPQGELPFSYPRIVRVCCNKVKRLSW